MTKPILCVDFDGVIHSYVSKWTTADEILDGPVPGAIKWLYAACEHFQVCIYSSRSKEQSGRNAMARWIYDQACEEFGIDSVIPSFLVNTITFSAEKPAAFLTIDDRAICFEGDWSKLDPETLLKFKPWNKR